jgi:hypothetical protein
MQKVARVISILALLVISFTSVSPAFAQTEALIEDQPERPLRDYVTAAFAAALNLDLLDVQSRLDSGETYRDIAAGQGVEGREFLNLMAEVIDEAVNEAIRDGVITAEDAERIREWYQRRRDFRRRQRNQRIGRAVLDRLEITREELAEMLASGMSWAEILESLGVDMRRPNVGDGFLEAVDLSREEIRERLAAGETLREIFTSEGVDFSIMPED